MSSSMPFNCYCKSDSVKHNRLTSFVFFVVFAVFTSDPIVAEPCPEPPGTPWLLRPRSLERTAFQQSGPLAPEFDLRTDVAISYGIDDRNIASMESYKNAGYVLHLMTGVSWGHYEDYLDGEIDGVDHWDEGQRDGADREINHGPRVPYMVPTFAFGHYLGTKIRRAIDAGVETVHMEEPEFWARAGYGKAFQRAWLNFHGEPWVRPDSSCDAQYRASKLKHHLYCRTLSNLADESKEYSLRRHGRPIRFFVPTHSLLNYAQWNIVSPESALLDLPGVDGMVCQTWTGTARTANIYDGIMAERTFETAFLEYGCMQELVRGSGKRMYLLHDPIEDDPKYDWNDYRRNYIGTLVASLFAPDSHHYEVCPWPGRVFRGKYPARSPEATPIPGDYATMLLTVFNQLRDMDQPEIDWNDATDGIGVFLSDTAMFQRAEPHFREGTVRSKDDPIRPTKTEVARLAGFYSLALPLVKHGVPVRPTIMENAMRYPGYLDRYDVLILSYEFQKPRTPAFHAILSNWVRQGGVLIYIGADTDPFHRARDWWNASSVLNTYASPTEHLFESLGLGTDPSEGRHVVGNGRLFIEKKHPAFFTRSREATDAFRNLVRKALAEKNRDLNERNFFKLRRGPYLAVSVMTESLSEEPLVLEGRLIDLLDAELTVGTKFVLKPGRQGWYLDLDTATVVAPAVLAASGRLESWHCDEKTVRFSLETPKKVDTVVRLLLNAPPKAISIDGEPAEGTWNEISRTVLIRGKGDPKGARFEIERDTSTAPEKTE